MAEAFDFMAAARDGLTLATRDRRPARLSGVAADGLIDGEVQMFGPCRWRADGRYAGAPAGAAGPLDLVPPAGETPLAPRKTVSMKDALAGAGRGFCCD